MTFYYDPTIEYHHMAPISVAGLLPAFYLAPQNRDDAHALYRPAILQLGLDPSGAGASPLGPRLTGLTAALACEFGDVGLGSALLEAASEVYEPSWDRQRGEFTWGFGLGEPYPRGQYNAMMAAAEAMSEGAWTRLFGEAHPERFTQPTVVDVDFPRVTLRQAWWDVDHRRLCIATAPQNEAARGRRTSFRIVNLDPAETWRVRVDGAPALATSLPGGELTIDLEVGMHRVEVFADAGP